jgi:hypothetical protein
MAVSEQGVSDVKDIDFKEGLAFAVLLSILAGLASTNLDLTPNQRILSWFLFIAASGSIVDVGSKQLLVRVASASLPAATYTLTIVFVLVVGVITGKPVLGSAGAIELDSLEARTGLTNTSFLLMFHIVVAVATTFGLLVAMLSGNVIRKLVRGIFHLDLKQVGMAEKILNTILRLLITVAAILSIFG